MAKKKIDKTEIYVNGMPCKEDSCNKLKKRTPCLYCGRLKMRGQTIIADREGVVYSERMNPSAIREHNKLSEADQQKAILRIWRAPLEE